MKKNMKKHFKKLLFLKNHIRRPKFEGGGGGAGSLSKPHPTLPVNIPPWSKFTKSNKIQIYSFQCFL